MKPVVKPAPSSHRVRHAASTGRGLRCTARAIALVAGLALYWLTPAQLTLAQSAGITASSASPAASDGANLPANASSPHGWLVAPALGRFPVAIMHLPPRDGNLNVEGTLKLANVLTEPPLALVADSARVLIVLRAGRGSDSGVRVRRVVSMTAARTQAGTWEYRPLGRTGVEPSLPGTGRVIDVCTGSRGPLVLLGPIAAESSPAIDHELLPPPTAGTADTQWRLLQLVEGKWQEVSLPASFSALAPSAAARLSTGPGGRATLWMQPADSPAAMVWTVPADKSGRPQEPEAAQAPTGGLAKHTLLTVDGTTMAAEVTASKVELLTFAGGIWRPLASVARSGSPGVSVSVIGLSGIARVAIVAAEATDAATSAKPPAPAQPTGSSGGDGAAADPAPLRVEPPPVESGTRAEMRSLSMAANRAFSFIEVSAVDGRTMFTGPAKRDGVVTTRDFHILTLAFSSMMVAVLLFVLRTDRKPVLIPPGSSLASGPRRAAATLVDAAAVTLLAGLFGVNISELFSAQILLSPGSVLGSIFVIMALGAVHGTISESLWGRTIGKFVTDCDVVGFRKIKPSTKPAGKIDDKAGAPKAAAKEQESTEESPRGGVVETAAGPVYRIGSYEIGQPMVWQAAARNAVKWLLWPLSLVALFDPSGRHPGDVIASTVVVEWPEEEEADGEE